MTHSWSRRQVALGKQHAPVSFLSQFNWKMFNKAPLGCEHWGTRTNKTLDRSQQDRMQGLDMKDDEVNHSRYSCLNTLQHISPPISQSHSPQCAALEWQSHSPTRSWSSSAHTIYWFDHISAARYLLKSTRHSKTQCLSCFLEFVSSPRIKVFTVTQALRGEDNNVRGHWNRNPASAQTD